MIRYEQFTKRFGRVLAVDSLDLEVMAGETLALIGPNGSGKTTLAKQLAGLLTPTRGHVQLRGQELGRVPLQLLHHTTAPVVIDPIART